jgi:hypothetical protein
MAKAKRKDSAKLLWLPLSRAAIRLVKVLDLHLDEAESLLAVLSKRPIGVRDANGDDLGSFLRIADDLKVDSLNNNISFILNGKRFTSPGVELLAADFERELAALAPPPAPQPKPPAPALELPEETEQSAATNLRPGPKGYPLEPFRQIMQDSTLRDYRPSSGNDETLTERLRRLYNAEAKRPASTTTPGDRWLEDTFRDFVAGRKR